MWKVHTSTVGKGKVVFVFVIPVLRLLVPMQACVLTILPGVLFIYFLSLFHVCQNRHPESKR